MRARLRLRGFAGVSSDGQSGGLALFWDDQWSVEIKELNERYIDAYVSVSSEDPIWRLTCVYGEPRVENRQRMWDTLANLRANSDLPWMLVGDFNEALWQCEHMSATPRPTNQMASFRELLQQCGLHDIGFSGVPFTYDNKRKGGANVKVRLDRVLADDRWRNIFSDARLVHLASSCSDHSPILVHLEQEQYQPNMKRCKQYEIFWERAGELPEIVEKIWTDVGASEDLSSVAASMKKVMSALQGWGSRKFGNIIRTIEHTRESLNQLLMSNGDQGEIRKLTDNLNELLYLEEMLWLQRSRINWLKEGDCNTKFFHSKAVWRARKNKIK